MYEIMSQRLNPTIPRPTAVPITFPLKVSPGCCGAGSKSVILDIVAPSLLDKDECTMNELPYSLYTLRFQIQAFFMF
jgi:hypothetical protein